MASKWGGVGSCDFVGIERRFHALKLGAWIVHLGEFREFEFVMFVVDFLSFLTA